MKKLTILNGFKNLGNFLYSILDDKSFNKLFGDKRGSFKSLFIGVLLIVVWQTSFLLVKNKLPDKYSQLAFTGMTNGFNRFLYFYYHLGLFPVTTVKSGSPDTKAGAEMAIRTHGKFLQTEYDTLVRFGDWGRIWAFIPSVWLTGSTENSSVVPFNLGMVCLALVLLYFSFWYQGAVLLGATSVILLGSNPYLLYSTFEKNLFALAISLGIILLALHLPMFCPRFKWSPRYLLIPIITGFVVATAREFRGDNTFLIVTPLLSYFFIDIPKIKRMVLILALCLTAATTSIVWRNYFQQKLTVANKTVQEAGGHVYRGHSMGHHPIWHTLFAGLGDFSRHRGYHWNDSMVYDYALPILKEKYHREFNFEPGDTEKFYQIRLESIPEYQDILKEKVIRDVIHNPFWYLSIILARILAIFAITTPLRISLFNFYFPLPFHSLLCLPVFLGFWKNRNWSPLMLIGFTFSLSLTPLLVYSGSGATYYSIFHIVTGAVILSLILNHLWIRRTSRLKSDNFNSAV